MLIAEPASVFPPRIDSEEDRKVSAETENFCPAPRSNEPVRDKESSMTEDERTENVLPATAEPMTEADLIGDPSGDPDVLPVTLSEPNTPERDTDKRPSPLIAADPETERPLKRAAAEVDSALPNKTESCTETTPLRQVDKLTVREAPTLTPSDIDKLPPIKVSERAESALPKHPLLRTDNEAPKRTALYTESLRPPRAVALIEREEPIESKSATETLPATHVSAVTVSESEKTAKP
jgi:hypothetical protein